MKIDYWVFRDRRGSRLYVSLGWHMFSNEYIKQIDRVNSDPSAVASWPTESIAIHHVEVQCGGEWAYGGWRKKFELVPIYVTELSGVAELDELLPKADTQPVYFIYSPGTDTIKIGTSWNVGSRIKSLQTASSAHLKCLAVTTRNSEAELHNMFAADHVHLEWFKPSPALCGYIASVQGIK